MIIILVANTNLLAQFLKFTELLEINALHEHPQFQNVSKSTLEFALQPPAPQPFTVIHEGCFKEAWTQIRLCKPGCPK
jgi:hypothetical protein